MVVHSGMYIPVSSRTHPSLLDLVIISPVLVLTLTHEPWYAAFKLSWYKDIFCEGCHSIEQTFFGKQMLSSHVYVHVGACCSTIQYCDESFNGAEVICRWLFMERVHFYKIPSYSWKAYPLCSTTKEKGCFIAPYELMKKKQDNLVSHQRWPAILANPAVHPLTTVAPQVWPELLHQYQQRNCLFSY